ncbi:uncharacterized protein EI97DRAFT_87115 [Westerdykella ornata]|uniref:Uncharacterized protein n=1 Tax=Westerdykella ornata TaxID=318751 RepID=A0A6A6JFM6_WESOR|nr:uncharacterized protein EI97DRAFT_87115 [Westerdykella ornata]KAF2275075.1 hypothetical protein EI97DRAFT_87115 [Westerdykella ornata]
MDSRAASLMQRGQHPVGHPGLAHHSTISGISRENSHVGHPPTSVMPSSQALHYHHHPPLHANPRSTPQAPNHTSNQSLLSAISSAVSVDGSAISPASSRAGRSSRPDSRSRQLQLEGSAKVSPVTPVMTIEESSPVEEQVIKPLARPASNDNYDLYADADGVVIVDGREMQIPLSARGEGVSPLPSAPPSENGGDERLTTADANEEPAITPALEEEEPRYSVDRPMSFIMGPRDESGRPQDQINSERSVSNQAVNGVRQQYGAGYGPPLPPSFASRPSQAIPPQPLAHRQFLPGTMAQREAVNDPRMRDPRQQHPQSQRMQQRPVHAHDPRTEMQMQIRQANPPMQKPAIRPQPAPGNQHDTQPQAQSQHHQIPFIQGTRIHHFGTAPSTSEEKPSKSKVTSLFKGLGNKTSSSHSQASRIPGSVLDAPELTNHKASFLASSNGLLPDQDALKKKNRRSFGILGGRPESVGRESHISHASHVSHDSMRVQATDSRLDLRYPADPSPFQGIPPQNPPPVENAETGKKKRFSGLGNIFGRGSSGSSADPLKNKLLKEDKKNQKAQKRNTAPATQVPSPQQWPGHAQQQGMQFGQPSLARSYTGTNGAPPQAMSLSPQARLPAEEIYQGRHASNPLPVYPPQQHQNPSQAHNQPSHNSGFMTTKQMAQQARLSLRAAPPSSGHPPVGVAEYSQRKPEHQHPPTGYFNPDKKLPSLNEGTPANSLGRTPPPQGQTMHSQPTAYNRSVSSPVMTHGAVNHDFNRQTPPTSTEPKYETPQIPAAYKHVSGAYVATGSEPAAVAVQSPATDARNAAPFPTPQPGMGGRQYSDPRMTPISPQISQISGRSQMPVAQRTHSDSSVSVVSPITSPSPTVEPVQSPPTQRLTQPRMGSITESPRRERPGNLNLPFRPSDEEFLRMYQRQHIEQQLAAQERLYTERTGQSPSPHSSRHTASPRPHSAVEPQPPQPAPSSVQGGFREVLPRNAAPPHQELTQVVQEQGQPLSHPASTSQHLHPGPGPLEQASTPAVYPPPMSPDDAQSPLNVPLSAHPPPPPPKIPHSPMQPVFQSSPSPHLQAQERIGLQPTLGPPDPSHQQFAHPQQFSPDYSDAPPPDEPPPYDGPALPHPGMDDKSADATSPSSRAPRPPNIVTNAPTLPRTAHPPRSRQPSLGILQHPQPASMAASPQRSAADMGAAMMMRQLSAQEEAERAERARRAVQEREKQERERVERLRNRARAEESNSSSGRAAGPAVVGTGAREAVHHGVAMSPGGMGWERRGSVANRQVFELPAEEDDEPVMRATSFPGMEWVPTVTED